MLLWLVTLQETTQTKVQGLKTCLGNTTICDGKITHRAKRSETSALSFVSLKIPCEMTTTRTTTKTRIEQKYHYL